MDGEFVCESTTYLTKEAVGGGNLIVMGESSAKTLAATEAAVKRCARSRTSSCRFQAA
jgi:formylmethanofuran--tetrahydromethanopterin N-formyltransferase